MSSRIFFLLLCLACGLAPLSAQNRIGSSGGIGSEAGSELTDQMDRLGIVYETTDAGNVRIIYTLEDDRTHLVFVYGDTYTYEGVEVREIKATAAGLASKKDYDQELLLDLMELNFDNKIGAWQLKVTEERSFLEFGLRIPVEVSDSDLKAYLELAGQKADEMELKITEADEF